LADIPVLQHLAIHSAQAILLREIARRGGEMRFSWDNAREDVRGMVADLLIKKIVSYVEFVTSPDQVTGVTALILTDVGRRVVSQLEDAQKQRQEVHSSAPEAKIVAT